MRLLLIRHGETESNRQGLALGRADVPLNETGIQQAQALARRLATEPTAAVYSSPLGRTLRTAEQIAAVHQLGVTVEPGLIEMDIGEIEGLTFPAIRESHPGLLERWTGDKGPEHPMPGGEALVDVAARAWETLTRLGSRHREATVVAVTHNFVILSLISRVMGMELVNFRRLRHSVAALTVLDVRPGRTRILVMNDTCHLDDE